MIQDLSLAGLVKEWFFDILLHFNAQGVYQVLYEKQAS